MLRLRFCTLGMGPRFREGDVRALTMLRLLR
jgi:hypothetical protein